MDAPVPVLVQASDARLAMEIADRLRTVPSVDVRTDTAGRAAVAIVIPEGSTEEQLPVGSLLEAGVHAAASGVGFVPLAASWQAPDAAPHPPLHPREADVLRLVADGWDTLEIARRLSYSERTVKNVIHQITQRLGLRNRPHAVAYAIKHGLI